MRDNKYPSVFTIIAEDSAALAGLLIAAVGVYLSHTLEMPVLDGVASILIGILLACTACMLIYETRGLLIGEGSDVSDSIARIEKTYATVIPRSNGFMSRPRVWLLRSGHRLKGLRRAALRSVGALCAMLPRSKLHKRQSYGD